MTRQQMFNAVWQHFVTEQQPQSGDVRRCNYRDPSGAKCALGLLIPDDLYTKGMEGDSPPRLFKNHPQVAGLLMAGFDGTRDQMESFARDLQWCHDDAVEEAACADARGTFHELVEAHLRKLAGEHALMIPA
jgi:hypothetical protein